MKIRALFMGTLLLTPMLVFGESQGATQDIFTGIYNDAKWGRNPAGEGISGVGSIYENAQQYVVMLQKFIDKHHIKSVVDVGCGDWEVSKYIRWGSIKYTGYDVVQSVIEKDILRYGTKKIRFICADGVMGRLPKADLLVCKDVLQHLPNDYIHTLISKMKNFKYCLITNDISAPSLPNAPVNNDIPIGSGRFVDLSKPPFGVAGRTILTYSSPGTVKVVFLVRPKQKTKRHR